MLYLHELEKVLTSLFLKMITFRLHLPKDIAFRVKWLNNKKATVFAIDDPEHVTTVAEQEKWFKDYEANSRKKFFTICDDDKPIGFMGLSNIDPAKKSASVFIMIGEDEYRGKGIGKISLQYLINFAFQELSLKMLTAEVNKLNAPSLNLNLSLGFQKTGETEKEIEMVIRS